MSEEELLFSPDLGSADDPSSQDSAVQSSGVSYDSSAGPSDAVAAEATRPAQTDQSAPSSGQKTVFICPTCGKEYVRKFYYDKHVIAHGVAAVESHIPSVGQFQIVMDDLMIKVLSALSQEHKIGADALVKDAFLKDVINHSLPEEPWQYFQKELSSFLLLCLTDPTKLLPQNRYEEALKKLNFYLNNEENITKLVDLLMCVPPPSIILSVTLARRLVFRMSSVLLDEIQIFIAQEMRGKLPTVTDEDLPMSPEETLEFMTVLGSFLRSLFQKGHDKQQSSQMFSSLCKCLRESFVFMEDGEFPSSKQFLTKTLWVCDVAARSECRSAIFINNNVISFFLLVEELLETKEKKVNSLDDVMSKIYSNNEALGLWYNLTHSYFGEENSLYVMRMIVSAYRELSIRLDLERLNGKKIIRKGVALRTNLKRN